MHIMEQVRPSEDVLAILNSDCHCSHTCNLELSEMDRSSHATLPHYVRTASTSFSLWVKYLWLFGCPVKVNKCVELRSGTSIECLSILYYGSILKRNQQE